MKIQLVLVLLLLLAGPLQSQSLREAIAHNNPLVVSHRGVIDGSLLENSLIGMDQAIDKGISFFELDIRVNLEGGLYLLHDVSLDRTTDHSGLLGERDAKALQPVQLKESMEPLPEFNEALSLAKEKGLFLMLDIKEDILNQAMDEVVAYGLSHKILLLTFDRDRAEKAFSLEGDFLISVLITSVSDLEYYSSKYPMGRLLAYVPKDSSEALFSKVYSSQIPIVTDVMGEWDRLATEDQGATYRDFQQRRKASIIVSDYPILLKSSLIE